MKLRPWIFLGVGVVVGGLLAPTIGAVVRVGKTMGVVANQDFPLVEIANERGVKLYELRKGEARPMPYGDYQLVIPGRAVMGLAKNNRGSCTLRAAGDVVVAETNEDAKLMGLPR